MESEQADIYGWDVETVEVSEATALGCALVAAVGAGIYNSYKMQWKKW